MSRNRLMLFLAGIAALAVAAGGFFLGVQPQLDRAETAKADAQSISSGNQTTRTEIARLREQAKSLSKMRAELAALRASVPSSAAASSFISQLNATADTTGVKVATITVGDAAAYTPPAATTSGSASSATDSGSATATPTPSASASASTPAAPETTTNSSITAANFSVIPVSVSVNGEFPQALAFVKGVQSNPRLFLIDSISSSMASTGSADSASGADSPSWTFSGSIYVLADEVSATATDG
ncbi:hypothetical protein GCM10017714_28060 [Curtobacterium pusillum]|uniref:Tfp pilus assembly protein PilO n=1 Tax=Curtobacterium pusillum TaxID=69373 RepID=A0ABX2M5K5_9MICO|nr:hypothetical protein [Curtobacterium pusillum]NUU13380.1 hypothetical protein [Curtobacterium pusillum]GLK32936.1 hypothetical protein GCM10017610_32210 [Curtobacterium pusillum]